MMQPQTHNTVIPLFPTLPVAFKQGRGIWLYDIHDREYLDAMGGMAVCCLGHAHPKITAAITDQASQLMHTTNFFQVPNQYDLADKMTELTGMEKAYFCSTGAETTEAAIKMTRRFAAQKNITQPKIVVTQKGLHGRSLATLSASDIPGIQKGYDPLVSGFVRVAFNDLDAIKQQVASQPDIVAVMVEPIQGEGGINVFSPGYLKGIRALCDEYGCLMILDEIQTGMGRTGQWYAFQHEGITPDILCSAKGLGNGFPIGACLVNGKATELFQLGAHGSTYGGNPLACRVSSTVIHVIEQDHLLENCQKMGDYLKQQLQEELAEFASVAEVRGMGLMIGVQINRPCRELLQYGLENRLIFNVTHNHVIRLLPALNITQHQCDLIVMRLKQCLAQFENHPA